MLGYLEIVIFYNNLQQLFMSTCICQKKKRITIFALFSAPAPINAPQGHFYNTCTQEHPKFPVWDVRDTVKINTKLNVVTANTDLLYPFHLSRVMRKPTFCICENKDADQLRGNPSADQRLCFHFTDSTIPLLSKSEISSL